MKDLDLAEFNNAVILVTGGAGFVGSNLVSYLLRNSDPKSIIVIDNYLSSDPENLPVDSRLRVLVGSAADPRVLGRLPDHIDFVFHLACYHGNQSSIHDPLADHDHNSYPSLVLFDFLSTRKEIQKVIYSAAGCAVAEKTFDQPAATSEDAPVSLFHDSPYSISKLIGEMYGNYYFSKMGMPLVKARFQNVYGPGEVLGAGQWRGTESTVWRNVVPTLIWKALNRADLFIDHGGRSTRDFIYVEDIVRGLILCAILGKSGESYNLGSGAETKIIDLAHLIVDLTESSSNIVILDESRPWDSSGRRFGDPTKAETNLGFRSEIPLSDGITRTILWTRENFEKIEKCILRHA